MRHERSVACDDSPALGPAAPPSPADPGAASEQALYARLLARDAIAPAELVERYLPALMARLARTFPSVDPHLVETAANDAVLDTAEHPERFDPARGSLSTYLRMAARGDVRNALAQEARHAARLRPLEESGAAGVALFRRGRNSSRVEGDDPLAVLERAEADASAGIEAALAALSPVEREVIELMLDGERRTSAYGRVLGLSDLPAGQQAQAVKRVKDRIKKRLRRQAAWLVQDG